MTENAGFLLILLLAGVLWFGTVKAFADRATLTENTRLMKKQFSLQEENYRIVSENFAEIRRMRHDLRHHLNAVMELARQHQYEELEHYISGCEVSANQAVQPALCEITRSTRFSTIIYSSAVKRDSAGAEGFAPA